MTIVDPLAILGTYTESHASSHAMFLLGSSLACIVCLALPACTATGGHVEQNPAVARDQWHAQRLAALEAHDGWLTLVGLNFLPEGVSTVGNAPSATFRYERCSEPIVGTFAVNGEQVQFTPFGGVAETCTSDDRGTPTVVRSGPVSFTLVRRNGRLALRVRDNESEVRTKFRGIALFPYDPALVVEASVYSADPEERVPITNVTGFVEETPVAARVRFVLAGAEREFIATSGANGRLFVVFGDATNGSETYGGGRFLDIPAPVDGKTMIDFNRATNPPCSFTAFATCPMPPAGNRLPIPIAAGERMPK
jgi:uncharacterized protein (DUF1684 family)